MRGTQPDGGPPDAALDAAIHALNRRDRSLSARSVFSFWQLVAAIVLGVAVWQFTLISPDVAGAVARAALWSVFSLFVVLRLFAAAASMAPTAAEGEGWRGPLPFYSILCPLYREVASVPALIRALEQLDYPADRRDVKLIVEADDAATMDAIIAMAPLPHGFEVVRVPPARPRTKPKALNYAMTFARGDFVAVFDAEDAPRPDQLRQALEAFACDDRLGAVQSPLVIDNGEASWIASQFAAEYAIQFRGILPLLAHVRAALPLGGAGNHFRRIALDESGRWDPFNVTEDADLGYRLARHGWRIGVMDSPTYEEAPARLGPWMRQRTRWIKGHMQTWLVLMRNPARTAREMGLGGFLWMQLVLGGGLVAACAHAPLFAFLLLNAVAPELADISATDWALVICGYATAALAALFAAVIQRDARLALSAATMPFYWPLSSFAAMQALVEILVSPHYWAKTDHGLTPREPHAD